MFIGIETFKAIDYQLCIIGAGPAGIILALEYADANPQQKILLVECGKNGTTTNPLDDSIRVLKSQNHHDPYDCTNKGLGGSTASWGGRCVMYDEIDFIPHGPVQSNCTWGPGFLDSVRPYLQSACDYFDCGRAQFELENPAPIAENFRSSSVTDHHLERWSLPTRFGTVYRSRLTSSENIHVLVGHYASSVGQLNANNCVNSVELRTLNGESSHSVNAEKFVFCAGGQESTRLLLKSPHLFKKLDAIPVTLGKYYQGHSSGKIAFVKFYGNPRKTEHAFTMDTDGTYCRRRFQFSKDAIVQNRILNIAFWLDIPPVYDPSHRNGTLSFIYLMMIAPVLRKNLLPPAIARSLTAEKTSRIRNHVWNVLTGLPISLTNPAVIFVQRYLRRRKLPGVYLLSHENRYALHFHSEQVPTERNRMTLSENGEQLEIHYEYTDDDIEAVIRSHELFDEYLRHIGCGELQYLHDKSDLPGVIRNTSKDGLHQMGTTRISNTPEDGVVDFDLRVWGTENLYVCSTSVFPTSSQANPTFFLGACAARLAAHLSKLART